MEEGMENKEFVIVVDFGGQYNQLIARRVRENHVYCEVYPYNKALDKIKELKPQGIIFTGGPNSVYEENSPKIEKEIFELGIPVLGMCYGMQFMAHTLGGEVKSADNREFGKTPTKVDTTSPLFKGLDEDQVVWMSHVDYVAKVPESKSLRIQKTALLHLCKIKNANYTLCNIMQKYYTLNMVKKCFTTSCMKYAVSQAHGQWQTMQKLLLMKSVTL